MPPAQTWDFGVPLVIPPPKEETSCPGPICTIMQNFTPIGIAVDDISVSVQKTYLKLNPLMGAFKPQSNGPLYGNTVIRYTAR